MDEILVLNNVSKSFDGIMAVKNVSISIRKGEIVGLIGPNGAGKTTLFNLITKTNHIRPDSGEIFYNSHKMKGLFGYQIARMGISRLFQDVKVWGSLTVIDHLLIAQTDVIGENPIYQLLFSSRCKETEERNLKEAENWLAFVNLEGYKTTKAKELSYGQQRF
ncbi:MAG: ATP-binding cassette domain-containing protein [Candidatus Brocadiaceae bacterium]